MTTADQVSQFDAIFREAALSRTWPTAAAEASWHEALNMLGNAGLARELAGTAATIKACLRMLEHPIVGVLGQLNAGKSSVVASFLSAAGQARLPRGLYDKQGTHRFVYWLPEAWHRDSSVWESFRELLRAVHESDVDLLADDPHTAAEQYASGRGKPDLIRRPIVAFDAGLNDLGFALLDCPDVQTRDGGTPQRTAALNPRVAFVCNAVKVCSTFLYVWEASKLRESLFADLLQGLGEKKGGIPVWLLVNKITPAHGEPGLTTNEDSLRLAVETIGLAQASVYAAFDYNVASRKDEKGSPQPGWEDLTPQPLVERFRANAGGHPQFFSVSGQPEENTPQTVSEDRFLHVALKSLRPADEQLRLLQVRTKTLAGDSHRAVQGVRKFVQDRVAAAQSMQSHLLEMAVRFFTDAEGQPKQLPDKNFFRAVQCSMERTAPLAIWLVAKARRGTEAVVVKPVKTIARRTIAGLTRPFRKAAKAADKVRQALDPNAWMPIEQHTPQEFARLLIAQRWFPTAIDEATVTAAIEQAFKTTKERVAMPNRDQLDVETARIWKHVSTRNATKVFLTHFLALLVNVAALGGVALAAVDGGATLLGMTSWSAFISSQLALCGFTAAEIVALLSPQHSSLVEFNTLPNLSRFFAVLCDVFQVPRPADFTALTAEFGQPENRVSYRLVDPHLELVSAVCPLGDQRQWQETPSVARLAQWASTNE
jgi:hypothetical protein